jgi:hypothetical protein
MARHRIAAIAGDGIGIEVEPAMMVDVVIAHSFGGPAVKDQMSRGLSDPTSIVARDKHGENNDFNIHR